jgi:hypothetical protein
MKNVHKSVLIWYSPAEMFALVTDVARYPEFLPWCDHTQVLEQDATGMTAEVGMSLGGLEVLRHAQHTKQATAWPCGWSRAVLAAGRALALPPRRRRQPARLQGRAAAGLRF